MTISLQFLGAAGTVTGSKYLLRACGKSILIDAGMFQGPREWAEKNWAEPSFDLKSIDLVLLTHAHIDHSGIIPRYFKLGLNCPILATKPTRQICELLLPDSGQIQEERTQTYINEGTSRHTPPLPLYTEKDAVESLALFKDVSFDQQIEVLPGIKATWTHMGHILGAAAISLEINHAGVTRKICFSGDIGRYNVPILKDPVGVDLADLLLIESTYGNKNHPDLDPSIKLAEIINNTISRKGTLLIPSFAVGRTQTLLYYIRQLKDKRLIADVPIVIDSPMSRDVTELYEQNPNDYDEEALGILNKGQKPFSPSRLYFVKDRSESIKLNSSDQPMVLISASGMLTGGRIMHHIRHRISKPQNTLLFVGHQPDGGKAYWIKQAAQNLSKLRIFGYEVPVKAEILEISNFSAHADRGELLRWCRSCQGTPKKVAIVHGEPNVAESFKKTLSEHLNWNAFVAGYMQTIEI